jgi:hypothetical protein
MGPEKQKFLHPIKDLTNFQQILDKGYSLKGPRGDAAKNLTVFKRFLKKGHEFIPEKWLRDKGCEFVEPTTFTQGLKLAYKVVEENLEEYFKSNYSLYKNNIEFPLYLKKEQ